MTVKSVIDIEVNDAKFKEFVSLFEKYRAALKDMPSSWGEISEEMKGASSLFEGIVAGMLTQSQLSTNITKQEKEQERVTRSTAGYWRDMSRSTRDVAGNIVNATKSLLKWVGLTSVFTGLLGAGGLYGIDRMAAGVASGRRSSTGLGTTYGGQKAFDIAYGQTINTGSFLSAVNEGLADPTKMGMFLNAGMTGGDLKGNTTDVAVRYLSHLQGIAKNTNPAVLGTMIDALGIPLSLGEMKNLGGADLGNLNSRFGREQTKLDLSKDTQDKWAQFTQQMQEAGDRLENVFVKGLVRIEPELEKLSDSFTKLIEDMADSDTVKDFIEGARVALEKFSKYVGSDSFEKDLMKVVKGVGALAHALGWVLRKFGVDLDKGDDEWVRFNGDAKAVTRQSELDRLSKPNPVPFNPDGSPISKSQKLSALEKQYGLPSGILSAQYQAESGGGKYLKSPKGALGPFQFMPDTAREYGVKDPMNFDQSSEGAAKYMQHLLKMFNGNTDQALAAYNWGPGNVSANVNAAKFMGGRWDSNLPKETRDYVGKVQSGVDGSAMKSLVQAISRINTARVEIMNNSGSNVITQVSQVAQ